MVFVFVWFVSLASLGVCFLNRKLWFSLCFRQLYDGLMYFIGLQFFSNGTQVALLHTHSLSNSIADETFTASWDVSETTYVAMIRALFRSMYKYNVWLQHRSNTQIMCMSLEPMLITCRCKEPDKLVQMVGDLKVSCINQISGRRAHMQRFPPLHHVKIYA